MKISKKSKLIVPQTTRITPFTTFLPPHCPNPHCTCHWPKTITTLNNLSYPWYIRDGVYSTALQGTIQRYRCKLCNQKFSQQTFRLSYYAKRSVDYTVLEQELCSCTNIRATSRKLHYSRSTITLSHLKMSRQTLAAEVAVRQNHTLGSTTMVIDGFESFVGSQYHPNNINLRVASDSRYIASFNYAQLNRKGRMTDIQKKRALPLTQEYRLPTGHLQQKIWLLISSHRTNTLRTICSDEKLEYREPIAGLGTSVIHRQISSKAHRTVQNPLFAVNQIDKMFRKDLSEHVRETQCYARDANNQMERLQIYCGYYNYTKKFLVKDPVSRDDWHHSDEAGIPREVVDEARKGLYTQRRFISHIYDEMSFDEKLLWFRLIGTPGRRTAKYLPKYIRDYVSYSEVGMSLESAGYMAIPKSI
ncbi:MAG: hypothetical protein HQ557_19000 [Bacteroidetes bacterium]|nr:hypothetical protein [Bacteroidota bacterium]